MAKALRYRVVNTIFEIGIIPLFYSPDIEQAKKITDSCYNGGMRVLEFTSRGDKALTVFSGLAEYISEKYPDMLLGVGSIYDSETAAIYIQSGADFIVSPIFSVDIARLCNRLKILWIPGCGTLTEIKDAESAGAEIVKLFPGGVYGPEFIKAVLGPSPHSRIMPTGGVKLDVENLKSWFEAGACCVGIGSELITKQILMNSDYSLLEQNVRTVVADIKKIK